MLFIIYLCYTNHYIQYEYNMALHFFCVFIGQQQPIGKLHKN